MERTRSVSRHGCRRGIGWIVSVGVAAAALSAGIAGEVAAPDAGTCVPAIPCSDPRGCPDLVVDPQVLLRDLFVEYQRTFKFSCTVLEGEVAEGDRFLLRFSSNTPNLGPGDLIIGNPANHPEWFNLQTCHGHAHLKEYADYRLWTPQGYQQWQALRSRDRRGCARDLLAGNPAVAAQMVAGRKQGFCVVDLLPSAMPCPYPLDPDKYFICDAVEGYSDEGFQGLSVCWADEYYWGLTGQWVDVTDLPDGEYVLEVEVNAEHFYAEADYTNNAAAAIVNVVKPVGTRPVRYPKWW